MFNQQTTYYKSPIRTIKIAGDENGIQFVSLLDGTSTTLRLRSAQVLSNHSTILSAHSTTLSVQKQVPTCLQDCVLQLKEYFEGTRTEFNLKLNPKGTEFQQKVWKELLNIPFNTTRTYLEQTKAIGDIKAIRAVASANGKNPIAIIIPCHRVLGSDGSLTGYAGGLWRKKWLLAHENPVKQQSLF